MPSILAPVAFRTFLIGTRSKPIFMRVMQVADSQYLYSAIALPDDCTIFFDASIFIYHFTGASLECSGLLGYP